ncbi:hypothetical protein EH277_04100 [Limosilactobacillus fermentum]|nr:hypothetical protein EH277_04100 [Limosilactobacillus fermentum]
MFRAKQVATKRPATGILWLHGGGYALESAENTLVYAEQLVADGRSVMVAPDYTTSALAPYPAALADYYLVLTWLRDNATRFGVNPNQLVVGGDSAGGGLTAAVCLRARDQGDVKIAWQIPIYPMLDDRLVLASAKNNDAPVWNSRVNQAAWDLYLGDLLLDKIPIYAAPGRALDHYELLKRGLMVLTCLILLAGFWYLRRLDLTPQRFLVVATWSFWTCTLFLPSMHDRYSYFVMVMLALVALLDRRMIGVALVSIGISTVLYLRYLLNADAAIDLWPLAIIQIINYCGFTVGTFLHP